MEFVARKEELNALRVMMKLNTLDGAVIYGKKKIGKTALIIEASKSFKGAFIYYQCLKSSDAINAKGLIQAIKDNLNDVFLSDNSSFSEVLEYIFVRGKSEPILLALDEYPYLSNRTTIDTKMQSLIDTYRHDSKMKVILAGSSIGVMETILDETNPLHGRFRYKMQIDAFDYLDASKFYPSASLEDKVAYYAVFGGIPYYLSMIDGSLTFEENLKRLVLDKFAPLESEILSTMKEEYEKIENATILMDAITRGKHSHGDIKDLYMSQSPKSDMNYLLDQLVKLRFLSKTYAINDYGKKKPYYDIEDNLFAFYFSLIYPNVSRRALLSSNEFYSRFVKERLFSSFIPKRFEGICKEYLIRKNKEGMFVSPFLSLGSYTYNNPKAHKNGQFDIVGKKEDGLYVFECKYTAEKVGESVYEEEKRQIEEAGIKVKTMGFFSKSGFTSFKGKEDCLCYDLNDIFA
ncbi:MAG: hypothetical protein K6B65_05855 [Bacilli bacterium]|nr:hypothetical protein [Bacilli bacterium]